MLFFCNIHNIEKTQTLKEIFADYTIICSDPGANQRPQAQQSITLPLRQQGSYALMGPWLSKGWAVFLSLRLSRPFIVIVTELSVPSNILITLTQLIILGIKATIKVRKIYDTRLNWNSVPRDICPFNYDLESIKRGVKKWVWWSSFLDSAHAFHQT